MNRRNFLKGALAAAAMHSLGKIASAAGIVPKIAAKTTDVSTVYFTHKISPQAVVCAFRALGVGLPGKVAVKVHSGEKGNGNFLRPEFLRPMIEAVNGTVVECNTAYEGARNSTEKHLKLISEHGWSAIFKVDIMDAEGPDMILNIPNGKILKKNFAGKNMADYDSMLVLSHFKGHPVAGYGGALKQLSIGCASTRGKALIHSGGVSGDQIECWKHMASAEVFGDAMADAALSVVDYFKGKTTFVNMMCNLSVDCDCCAAAEAPCMKDIGILSSTDPVALDQACMDLIRTSGDPGRSRFLDRVTSRKGTRVIDAAEKNGVGSKKYKLIHI